MTTRPGSLAGRTALVTGASSGIGRAIALAYAEAGADLVAAARRPAALEEVVEEARGKGVEALGIAVDVTDPAAVEHLMLRAKERFGGLDVVLCNAGGNVARGPAIEVDPHRWIEAMQLNVTGAFLTARAAVPLLRARGGGRILMMGSGMGHRGVPGHSAYCAGKAAQWMLVRCLAQELVEDGISVNEIIPGPVTTPATLREQAEGGQIAAFATPGEWPKQPEDVVPLALFLADCPHPGPTAQSFSLMRRQG